MSVMRTDFASALRNALIAESSFLYAGHGHLSRVSYQYLISRAVWDEAAAAPWLNEITRTRPKIEPQLGMFSEIQLWTVERFLDRWARLRLCGKKFEAWSARQRSMTSSHWTRVIWWRCSFRSDHRSKWSNELSIFHQICAWLTTFVLCRRQLFGSDYDRETWDEIQWRIIFRLIRRWLSELKLLAMTRSVLSKDPPS